MHDNTEYVLESLRAGAHGYLLKDTAATELRGAIRAVRRGESYFSPPIAGRLSAVVRGEAEPAPSGALGQLTARERQVLVGVAQGQHQPGDRRSSSASATAPSRPTARA